MILLTFLQHSYSIPSRLGNGPEKSILIISCWKIPLLGLLSSEIYCNLSETLHTFRHLNSPALKSGPDDIYITALTSTDVVFTVMTCHLLLRNCPLDYKRLFASVRVKLMKRTSDFARIAMRSLGDSLDYEYARCVAYISTFTASVVSKRTLTHGTLGLFVFRYRCKAPQSVKIKWVHDEIMERQWTPLKAYLVRHCRGRWQCQDGRARQWGDRWFCLLSLECIPSYVKHLKVLYLMAMYQ